jgi:hypothetical protein
MVRFIRSGRHHALRVTATAKDQDEPGGLDIETVGAQLRSILGIQLSISSHKRIPEYGDRVHTMSAHPSARRRRINGTLHRVHIAVPSPSAFCSHDHKLSDSCATYEDLRIDTDIRFEVARSKFEILRLIYYYGFHVKTYL